MGERSEIAEVARRESRTQRVKITPPKLPSRFLGRDALERRLDAAATHRVTAVVAAAGFGKSTQLASRALANDWSWYTIDANDSAPAVLAQGLADALRLKLPDLEDAVVPTATVSDDRAAADSLAVALSHALDEDLSDELVLVIDDVHELGRDAAAARVLEGLARYAPPELHLVLSSRDELPFTVARLRGQGGVLDFDGADFVFGVDEIAAALRGVGADGTELAPRLHEATAGWPVAVQLATEMLASLPPDQHAAALDALGARRGPLFAYLAEEVFVRERQGVRDLLRVIVDFDRVTARLCDALGLRESTEILDDLARRGLLAEAGGTYTPHDLVRQFASASWPLAPSALRELRRSAGLFFEAEGDAVAATKAFTSAGDHESIVRVWRHSWRQLDEAPAVETVLEAAAILQPSEREICGDLAAHALIIRGDVDEARRWLAQIDPARKAHFHFLDGLAHMHRFEHREAVEKLLLARDTYEDGIDPHCSLFAAYELIYLGRVEEARLLLAEAWSLVGEDNPGAAAEAQLLVSDLGRCDGDLTGALAAAVAGAGAYAALGNVLGECSGRARVANLLHLLGRHDAALEAAAAATRLSEQIGFSHFQAWTAATRGLVLLESGRLDEAAEEFALSLSVHERLLTSGADDPLIGLGDIHRDRGERAQARSTYERALATAERSGSAAGETLACAGLGRLLADEDPTEALKLASRSVERSPGVPERIQALVAKGWILVRNGDVAGAAEAATEARSAAGLTGSPAFLAKALELAAFATVDGTARVEMLQEALGIRRRLGERHASAITTVALGSVDPASVTSDELNEAEQTMRELGIQTARAAAGLLLTAVGRSAVPLSIETLGRFAVLREGAVVTAAEWQSKKARDLLKILVTRRGQATPRDYVIELLWPDDDPARTSKRLAVAVNVLRNVLDPQRNHGSDHFIAGGAEGLRLQLGHLAVDVEEFLVLAGDALEHDESDRATTALAAAESAYTGEFLPEDRYEDWAAPLRDEARAAYQRVVRALATRTTDPGGAVRYLLRLLAVDSFDEEAHLLLVRTFDAAGMHGEARRAYRRYVERMDDIGLEPTAYDRAVERP